MGILVTSGCNSSCAVSQNAFVHRTTEVYNLQTGKWTQRAGITINNKKKAVILNMGL